jgi:hypothetical protein
MRVRTLQALRQLVTEGGLAMSKIPSFPFYIGDWMKDPALRSVSRKARGLWIDMLCLMWECPRRGMLAKPDGSPFTLEELRRMLGGDRMCAECTKNFADAHSWRTSRAQNRAIQSAEDAHAQCQRCEKLVDILDELSTAGVSSISATGVIYSRRIVRDEAIRTGTRNRVNDYRERQKVEIGSAETPKSNADVTPPRNADVTHADPGCNANVTVVGTTDVTPLYTAPSSSSTSSTSSSVQVQRQKPLKTLVDVPPTQAPSPTSPDQSARVVSDAVAKPEERRPEDLKARDGQIIAALFGTYCDEFHRDPTKYTLTPIRKAKALLRLHERTKIRGSMALAVDEINTAIKNLAASEYHVSNGYIDWTDQIFRSAEEFEKRLNWVKPNGGKSHASGYETLDQRNERIFQETLSRMDIDSPEDDGEPETEPDTRKP